MGGGVQVFDWSVLLPARPSWVMNWGVYRLAALGVGQALI